MRTYLIISDFIQKRNKRGEPYGWHYAHLATPETKWGYDFVVGSYSCLPVDSWEEIRKHMQDLYPEAAENEIWALLGIRVLSHEPI